MTMWNPDVMLPSVGRRGIKRKCGKALVTVPERPGQGLVSGCSGLGGGAVGVVGGVGGR